MPETAIEKSTLKQEQIDLIRQTVAKGATDLELKLFLYQCQRTGLDPLSKQIHFIKRWNEKLNREEGTIQTGIDGYRSIADRTGQYAGSDDAVFRGPEDEPVAATVTVWRIVQGQRVSFTATAWWKEYFPTKEKQQFFWKKMPHGQLAKCAEALALRKAFPQQLSGVYTHEEMQQAGPEVLQIGGKVVEANTKEAADAVAQKKIADGLEKVKAQEEAKKQAASRNEPPGESVIEGMLTEISEVKKGTRGEYVTISINERFVYVFNKDFFKSKGNEDAPLAALFEKPVRATVKKQGSYLHLVSIDRAAIQVDRPVEEDPFADAGDVAGKW